MTDADAPDIPPALTDEEWKAGAIQRLLRLDGPEIRVTHETALQIGGPGMPIEIKDANDIAAMMALCNELLVRMDDPRAFTRELVADLRKAAEIVEREAFKPEQYDQSNRIDEFADALESMLRPESLTAAASH